jgi:MFS family permease
MRQPAAKFIVFLGIVSLFADMTYEGARGVIGPYLLLLGASGSAVGIIVGIAELFGYALRGISGILTDQTKQYWAMTFIGYIVNLVSVPLLAFTHHWQIAAGLVILERVGKSIRVPPRDAMLSFAAKHTGRGWGFGLHEALDQVGAVFGPLSLAVLLYYHEGYPLAFLSLAIPAILSLITLYLAKRSFPQPEHLEIKKFAPIETKGFDSRYWTYLTGAGFATLGFTSFALIAYHLNKSGTFATPAIPLLYAIANAVAGFSSLLLGWLYDRKGISFLAAVTAISALFAPFVFLGSTTLIWVGMILWGVGEGSQGSIMRAVVAHLVPPEKRGSAYGLFNLIYGVAGALGSGTMGVFYDISALSITLFSLFAQCFGALLFLRLLKKTKSF